MKPYIPETLTLVDNEINPLKFLDELIDASSLLAVYMEKLHDSQVSSDIFMPTLQLKEAVSSSRIEGTQVTLESALKV